MSEETEIKPAIPGSLHPVVGPLFLYLKSCKMEKSVLAKLRDAGYLPIAVESFDAIKVVEPLPLAASNSIIRAAFSTIAESEWSSIKEKFGSKVARILAG